MKKRKKEDQKRTTPAMAAFVIGDSFNEMCCTGYTRIADCPEVQMAVNYIAELISSMTIHLMKNTNKGDVRQKNELAKKVDINPWSATTRKIWMFNIVRNMLIEGNQVVYPQTSNGLLVDLIPLKPASTSFLPKGNGYYISYAGQPIESENILHFLVNPDSNYPWKGLGYRVPLKSVTDNLKQAAETKKGFMASKWKPSVIVKVDGMVEEFSSPEGRAKLVNSYIKTNEAGEPWLIPADQFSVEQIKPLSLNDLAINDAVTIDKKAVAGIIGVPPYVVGAGNFNKDEHRNFINTKIMPIAQIIAQELTKKLLISPEMYFKLSGISLYGYDIKELSDVGQGLYVRGIVTGNEVRDWIGLSPKDGLDERVILENYIPAGMIGDQKKLNPKGGQDE